MRNKRGRKSYERLISSLRGVVEEAEDLAVAFDKVYALMGVIDDAQTLHEVKALTDRVQEACASIVACTISINLLTSLVTSISDASEGGDDAN